MARIGPIGRTVSSAAKGARPSVRTNTVTDTRRRGIIALRWHLPRKPSKPGRFELNPGGIPANPLQRAGVPCDPRPDGSPILWANGRGSKHIDRKMRGRQRPISKGARVSGGGFKPRARAESESHKSQSQERQPESKRPAYAHASPRVERTKQELLPDFLILFYQEPIRHPGIRQSKNSQSKMCVGLAVARKDSRMGRKGEYLWILL